MPFEDEKVVETNLTKKYSYKDNLILYRTNAQSRIIEEELIKANIPYRVVWWMKFYDRAEIKDLLAYLKVIHNPSDVIAMKRIINKPTRKIGDKTIEILDNYREKFDKNYFQIIKNIDEVEELNNWAKSALKLFLNLLECFLSRKEELQVADLLKEVISKTKYTDFITDWLLEEEKQSKKDNIDELINVASEYNWMENSLSIFLEEIALITDLDMKDDRNDYVVLMTVHSSKWLEQKRVFITGLEEWIFPTSRSVFDNSALEEERRLMYVAMTRAKEELYISRALERFQYGEFKRNLESRFVKEIASEYVEKYDLWEFVGNKYFSSNVKNIFDNSSSQFSVLSKPKVQIQNNDISQFLVWIQVFHPKFWNGTIIELVGEIASVSFSWNVVRKMNIKIAPIKRI